MLECGRCEGYVVQNVWQFMLQHILSHASVSLNFKRGKLLHVCNWLKQVPWRLHIKSRSCSRFFRLQIQFGGTVVTTNQKWFQLHVKYTLQLKKPWPSEQHFSRKYSTQSHECKTLHAFIYSVPVIQKHLILSINWQVCFKCFIIEDTSTTTIT